MFDQDSLWNYIYIALEKEWPDAHKSKIEGATERICDAVSEWVPKKGDYWLNEDDGMLYVNRGWKVVPAEAPEPVDWLDTKEFGGPVKSRRKKND